MRTESLELIPQLGGGYLLRRTDGLGTATEIALVESNVLLLPRLAREQVGRILETRSTPAVKASGAQAKLTAPVGAIRAAANLHRASIILDLEDGFVGELSFSLSPDQARAMAHGLLEEADALEHDAPPQTKQ